jgi:hypothetical protein
MTRQAKQEDPQHQKKRLGMRKFRPRVRRAGAAAAMLLSLGLLALPARAAGVCAQ